MDTKQLLFVGGTVEVPFAVDVWPGVPFAGTLRPPTPAEVFEHRRAAAEARDPVARRAEFYARHLRTWNLPDPVSAEAALRLHPAVFELLDAIVCGGLGCRLTAEGVAKKPAG